MERQFSGEGRAQLERLQKNLVACTTEVLVARGIAQKEAFEIAEEVVAAAYCINEGITPGAKAELQVVLRPGREEIR